MLPPKLTHLDESGRARMVDVSAKDDTERIAIARGEIVMQPETLALIRAGSIKKGDVLTVAQVAGIMAAKKTAELIPALSSLAAHSDYWRYPGSSFDEIERAILEPLGRWFGRSLRQAGGRAFDSSVYASCEIEEVPDAARDQCAQVDAGDDLVVDRQES